MQCCGGMGFLAMNRIGPIKTDTDVDATFEGDNTVMMQQVGRDVQVLQATLPAAASLIVLSVHRAQAKHML